MNARKKPIHQQNANAILHLAPVEIPGEPEFEEFLLAQALNNPDVFPSLIDKLKPEDFFLLRALYIWRAMELIDSRGEEINTVSVKEELETHPSSGTVNALEYIGGLDGLMTVATKQFDFALPVEALAHSILSMAKRRRLVAFGDEVRSMAMRKDMAIDEIATHVEKQVAVTLETVTRTEERAFSQALTTYFNYLESIVGKGQVGLPTGFKSLDVLSYGSFPGEISMLAGHAGMGKTAMLLSHIANVCDTGGDVDLFPLEMSEEEIVRWFIARKSCVPIPRLRSGELSDEEWLNVVKAFGEIGNWKLRIHDDLPGLTPLQFKRRMARVLRHGKSDLAAVDGLWLMNADDPQDANGAKDTNGKMRELATIVKRKTGLGIPLWITHQFNQDTKKRKDKKPQLGDLDYGGAKDAHNVYGLFRMDYFTRRKSSEPTELHILKSRSGNYGTAFMYFMTPGYVDVTEVYPDGE